MERRVRPQILFAFVCFGGLLYLQSYLRQSELESDTYLNPPPEYIEYFTFGFNESMADSLWLRWIQDAGSCQTYHVKAKGAPIPIHEANGDFSAPRHKNCDNSWGFKMLDAITRVAPKFEMPYEAGAVMLSVLVEDYEGAKVIFDRGIETYPHKWNLLYHAAYHYLFDRGDYAKAAELLTRAADNGAPPWVNLLAARLYSKGGKRELGLTTLRAFLKKLTNPDEIKRVEKRIKELEEQADQ